MKHVTIILLNWNGWRDTLTCLSSLQDLNYPKYSIILVDNASTDDSVARIRSAYPELTILVSETNLGFGGGCNIGINRALAEGTDFIWLLNNDTKVDQSSLAMLVERIECYPQLGCVGSVLYNLGQNSSMVQAWGGGHINLWTGRFWHFYAPAPKEQLDFLTGASMLIRNEIFTTVGLFDESFFMYWEDADLCFRIRKAGWQLAVADNSAIWHKESGSLGKTNPLLARMFFKSYIYFLKKHAPTPIFPISISLGIQLLKRIARNQWRMAYYALIGARDGLKESALKKSQM